MTTHTDDIDWRERLTPEQYYVLREGGTERLTGAYCDETREGTYHCAGCGAELFSSEHKFTLAVAGPFFPTRDVEALLALQDTSHGMLRTEIRCRNCGGHLGHVFRDGPPPTYIRYCINSVALTQAVGLAGRLGTCTIRTSLQSSALGPSNTTGRAKVSKPRREVT